MTVHHVFFSRIQRLPLLVRRRPLPPIGCVCILIILLLASAFRQHNVQSRQHYQSASDRLKPSSQHSFDRIEPDLHLLIPATEPNVDLCKTLVSAAVLGYPSPTLINWRKKQDAPSHWRHEGTHIGKINGVLNYLTAMKIEHGDQLVLMIDGYDTWFQLPPTILGSRYRSVGKELYNRTVTSVGARTVAKEAISQSIIFSAQKNCGPHKKQWDEVACYAQPASPLRSDLYGDDTDTRDPEKHLPLHMRPAFLNSGFIIGPARDMKSLMERAVERAIEKDDHEGSDQHIFNEIFGEQEYQREVARQRNRGMHTKAKDVFKNALGLSGALVTDAHPDHKPMDATDGPFEYGIGLDYGLEMSQSAVFSEFDGRFLIFSDSNYVSQTLKGPGLPEPPRVSELPADVAKDGPEWSSRPLYTNLWTSSIPITLHMNGFKSMRQSIWDEMWFYKSARDNLDSKFDSIAKDDTGNNIKWADICLAYEEELFGVSTTRPQG